MTKIKTLDALGLPGPRDEAGQSVASDKNQALIEPLYAPDLYARHFDGEENKIAIGMKDGSVRTYEFLERIDDKKTSFAASVLLDQESGHAIILYKGMDVPGRNEGSGRGGFIGDLRVAYAAKNGEDNIQTPPAEQTYLNTLNDPRVKSLEIIGYSIGSLHLNTMAAKYGAQGTAIADMGISNQVLTSIFNKGVEGPGLNLVEDMDAAMKTRVTSLKKEWDKLPASSAASAPRGTVISLDQGSWTDILGLAHIPQVYAADAEKMLQAGAPAPVPGGGMAP